MERERNDQPDDIEPQRQALALLAAEGVNGVPPHSGGWVTEGIPKSVEALLVGEVIQK